MVNGDLIYVLRSMQPDNVASIFLAGAGYGDVNGAESFAPCVQDADIVLVEWNEVDQAALDHNTVVSAGGRIWGCQWC